jgi:hypothetical protein
MTDHHAPLGVGDSVLVTGLDCHGATGIVEAVDGDTASVRINGSEVVGNWHHRDLQRIECPAGHRRMAEGGLGAVELAAQRARGAPKKPDELVRQLAPGAIELGGSTWRFGDLIITHSPRQPHWAVSSGRIASMQKGNDLASLLARFNPNRHQPDVSEAHRGSTMSEVVAAQAALCLDERSALRARARLGKAMIAHFADHIPAPELWTIHERMGRGDDQADVETAERVYRDLAMRFDVETPTTSAAHLPFAQAVVAAALEARCLSPLI